MLQGEGVGNTEPVAWIALAEGRNGVGVIKRDIDPPSFIEEAVRGGVLEEGKDGEAVEAGEVEMEGITEGELEG